MPRPVIYVLAGVNGAGKSSVGGHLLEQQGATWFDPDRFARELRTRTGCDQLRANAEAWQQGKRRLRSAIDERKSFAFETTLGGNTMPAMLREASRTHDVIVWFCGLDSVDLHLRVFDNSRPAAEDGTVPDPVLVLEMRGGCVRLPAAGDAEALTRTPAWARPLVQAALKGRE
jgi:shikimate kinase